MALTFSLNDTWDDGKRIHVTGSATASGRAAGRRSRARELLPKHL